MTLTRRLTNLEAKSGQEFRMPTIYVRVVNMDKSSRLARIHAPWGEFSSEDGEAELGFVMRAHAAADISGPAEELSGDDLKTFLTGRVPAIAQAVLDDEEITDDLLASAMADLKTQNGQHIEQHQKGESHE
ncbi:hypothetical protein [Histidinibacterium aquaticum]|uniref:Uncharacterized protein n=1 Tax=Histidinibacterium aquaticum TaxID=2613962 RepID=A0A5J5GD36_9RHOB|nr:hypothetical protein [Histidinibacterium aquaticum]KAA9005937.1 hypothetical protein F3S47_15370 [Histidinibacterium aquaticum]